FEMTSKNLGCTGVINKDNELVGIITDGDLRRHINSNFMELSAAQIMTKNPIVTEQNMLVVEAINIMNKKGITDLFVVEKLDLENPENKSKNRMKAVGILHIHDCLRAGIV